MGAKKKPNFCALLAKICKAFRPIAKTRRMQIGLVLLLINVPFGCGGAALGLFLSGALNNNIWLKCGVLAYILSWIMLGMATILLGTEAKRFASKTARKKWLAWRRARRSLPTMITHSLS